MVLAPEHELVDPIVPAAWPEGTHEVWTGGHATPAEAVAAYREQAASKSDVERQAEAKDKTGVFTGAYAINPVNGEQVPVFIADYVLMGYGTGAIMAVPGHDERDFAFAERLRAADHPHRASRPTAVARRDWETPSPATTPKIDQLRRRRVSLDGLGVAEAKAQITDWLEAQGHGEGTVNYRLRDWLFSRQRYWGEPFPIVYDEDGLPHALPESMLPLELPEVEDYSPRTFDPDDADTQPGDAAVAQRGLGQRRPGPGRRARRRTAARPTPCPTGPAPAGTSCATWTRTTTRRWSTRRSSSTGWARASGSTPAASTCTSAAPSTPCCTCCTPASGTRCCSTWATSRSAEPFHKLFNQGMIQAYVYRDEPRHRRAGRRGRGAGRRLLLQGEQVNRECGQDGQVPEERGHPGRDLRRVRRRHAAAVRDGDGPAGRVAARGTPARSSAVPAAAAAVAQLVVDEATGEVSVVDDAGRTTRPARALHKAIDGVRDDMEGLRFNTAIAKIIELNNHADQGCADGAPREVAEPLVLLMAPLAPHIAEELWRRLGHDDIGGLRRLPGGRPGVLVDETVTCVVQVKGKVRGRIEVAADADEDAVRAAALAEVAEPAGRQDPEKVIVVKGRMVSIVV